LHCTALHCTALQCTPLHSTALHSRLLYLLLLAGGSALMAAMLTKEVQHNLQSAFKG
jgi:hypothetical protein